MISQADFSGVLRGFRVLITRPMPRAATLCRLVEQAGGVAVHFPTLEILPSPNAEKAMEQFHDLAGYKWIIFISANAVKFALSACGGTLRFPSHIKVAAIGRATAKALTKAGIQTDLVPGQPFDSEALLETVEMNNVDGSRCLIVRGHGGRELLADSLHNRGAEITYVEVYTRTQPSTDVSSLIKSWQIDGMDIVTVASGQTLENLFAMMGADGARLLKATPMLVNSPRLRSKALELGVTHVMLAPDASDNTIFYSLCEFRRISASPLSSKEEDYNVGSTKSRS